MYRILDSYGTNQTAWRWAEALEWLAPAAPDAVIVHRLTGAFLATRMVQA